MIPYGKQDISQADIDAVIDVLKSDFLTQGPVVPEFEDSLSKYVGAKYAIAVNSATSALHIACLSLGVNKKSLVWTSAISFVASSNCALYCGANVDFVDIDRDTINLSADTLLAKLLFNKNNNLPMPDVLIVVHMAGQSCDMESISSLAKEYNFKVIEDASHAIGAQYAGYQVGCCLYSDISVFSFHPVKIITTGEGGAAVTNDAQLHNKMCLYRSHGITRDPKFLQCQDEPWYYEQQALGFNYRMTEIQAALGMSQLNRINQFIESRKNLAETYTKELANLPIKLPKQINASNSSWHLYIIQLDSERLDRKTVFNQLRNDGIGVNVHYRPIYLNPYYEHLGFEKGHCIEAESYYKSCISIPLYHSLSSNDQGKVIRCINEACS